MMVQTGMSDVVVAGGCESMSNVEHYSTDIRKGVRAGNLTLHDRLTRGRVMSQPIERFGDLHGQIVRQPSHKGRQEAKRDILGVHPVTRVFEPAQEVAAMKAGRWQSTVGLGLRGSTGGLGALTFNGGVIGLGAIGVKVANAHQGPTPMITLATAHPAKFPDAVQAAIVVLEDSPLFNAGRGAVLTAAGTEVVYAIATSGEAGPLVRRLTLTWPSRV